VSFVQTVDTTQSVTLEILAEDWQRSLTAKEHVAQDDTWTPSVPLPAVNKLQESTAASHSSINHERSEGRHEVTRRLRSRGSKR
jgi:hypothetical protein